jgi:hypothetical protein
MGESPAMGTLFYGGKEHVVLFGNVSVHQTVTREERGVDHIRRFKTGIVTNSDNRKNVGNIKKVHK